MMDTLWPIFEDACLIYCMYSTSYSSAENTHFIYLINKTNVI